MTSYIYPSAEWLEAGEKFYGTNPQFEDQLRKLTGFYCFKVGVDSSWGIEDDIHFMLGLESGKLLELKHIDKDEANQRSTFVLSASPQIWKEILVKEKKFVGTFMAGKIKLDKGDAKEVLLLAPYAGILVDVLTSVNLQFPDDLSPEDLSNFKRSFGEFRLNNKV